MSHDPLVGLTDAEGVSPAEAPPMPITEEHAPNRGDGGVSDRDATVVLLESTLTIAEAAELHEDLLGHMRAMNPLVINASDVEMVDTAGLQLIAATFKTASEKGVSVRIEAPSECFAGAVRQIGLGVLLGLDDDNQVA